MRIIRNLLILTAMMVSALKASAQVSVEQSIDSVAIYIGQQVHVRLTVTMPEGARLQWPRLKERQYITPGVEVVELSQPDTISSSDNQLQVERSYTLTSFDEHVYAIPPLAVKVNGKSYRGNGSALKVVTVDVDTLHPNQFFPPKDVQNNPFMWTEWAPYFWLALLVVVMGLVVFYLFIRLKQNKPIITRIHIVKKLPAHQRALMAIDKIKAEKMQTSEDQKTYYTQLTDTLRRYIEERFGFNAMEMTSSEIIDQLQQTGDKKMLDELRELFQTADLVKFAKYSTQLNVNDMNLVNAINFIDETKTEEKPTEERVVPQLSQQDQQTRKNRVVIKLLLWALSIGGLLLLAYIIYNVYLLVA